MRTSSKNGIVKFVQSAFDAGMRYVVCSPGSRNAPLIIAFDAHPQIKTYVVHDERSAAFYALGMADFLQQPVGIVCTSGSALLNYYPAIAEAYYRAVPLVVLSADRPAEWVNHGDGQTIVQQNVYQNHIRFQATIEEHSDNSGKIQEGFNIALGKWRGPIHFNFPLSEPLYETQEVDAPISSRRKLPYSQFTLSSTEKSLIKSAWKTNTKVMILCGQMYKNSRLHHLLEQFSNRSSVSVLTENTSNLVNFHRWNHCVDRSLSSISEEELPHFQPEILITIGEAIISKRIKQFLREAPIRHHWRVASEFPEMDTYRHLTHQFDCTAVQFFEELNQLDLPLQNSNFSGKWKQLDFKNQEKLIDFLPTSPYSDFSVIHSVLDFLPENSVLHMANSSVVRYCQLFDPISSVEYYCNRGTSGIDGSTSTAAGFAIHSPKLNVLITGDVSFFYDSNAFWNSHFPDNLKVILVNNAGGGIFRIISGSKSTEQLEDYFEAKHETSAKGLCETHSVAYARASNQEEVNLEVVKLFECQQSKVLEIFTPSNENSVVLEAFFKKMSGEE